MRILLTILTTAILVAPGASLLALQSPSATESEVRDHIPVANAAVRQAGCKSLSEAVEQVRRENNGRIVSAETQVSGGRETHIIKVLTGDGTVKTVRVPGCRV